MNVNLWILRKRSSGLVGRPVYTRNCQLPLWEWRTGLLGLWTNLLRALVMSKCPQARSTGWCWQVKRDSGPGLGVAFQTCRLCLLSLPHSRRSSHSKSQSTFLIISACWLWTGDRDQHGMKPAEQVEPGYRQEGEPSCWPHSVPLLIVLGGKKKLYASSLNPIFILLSVSPFCRNCSHWSHNLPNSTNPFPLSCDVSSACDVGLENRNECFHQCLSQSTVTDSPESINTFFERMNNCYWWRKDKHHLFSGLP